jgi:hypothetical protein
MHFGSIRTNANSLKQSIIVIYIKNHHGILMSVEKDSKLLYLRAPTLHAQPGDLDLPLHPHPIVQPGPQPLQVEPIPIQSDSVPKVLAIRNEVRIVFLEERMMHGPVASTAIPCKETCLLYCRLRVRPSLGSRTCGIFLVPWCSEVCSECQH